jgi:hypothetical protein
MLSKLNTYGTLFIVIVVVLAFLARGKLLKLALWALALLAIIIHFGNALRH